MPHAWSSRARNLGAVAQYAPPHHDLMLGTRLLAHLLGRRVRAEEEDAHGGCRLPSRKALTVPVKRLRGEPVHGGAGNGTYGQKHSRVKT